MRARRTALAIALVLGIGVPLAACGSDDPVNHPWRPGGAGPAVVPVVVGADVSGTLAAAGASSQESAMAAWAAAFQSAHPDVVVSYDPVGSGGGRTQFLAGGIALAGSDAPLDEAELRAAEARCAPGAVAELPLYVSPIAVVFHLPGIDGLRMTPATLAGVFAGEITRWDAPQIAADNPGVDLPSTAITPVVRSDESGTTETFTAYLAAAAPEVWRHGATGTWPTPGGQSAQGTTGVVQTVRDGVGTIGYADASKAGELGTVALRVAGEDVHHSPEAAAALLAAAPLAPGRPAASLVVDPAHADVPGAYPLVLVSYTIACTAYDDAATADLVRAFLGFVASEEGQALAASAAGVAPVPDALREDVMAVVAGIAP